MTELTSTQRKRLRGLAHGLSPAVQVGARGASEAVIRQLDEALDRHELVKVRLELERPQRAAAIASLSAATAATVAGVIGKVAVVYRPQRNPDRRRVDPGV